MTKNDIRRWLQWSTDPTDAGLRGSAAPDSHARAQAPAPARRFELMSLVQDLKGEGWRRREAEAKVVQLTTDAYLQEGVLRWKSNDRVPPADILELAQEVRLPGFSLKASERARSAELDAFIDVYRKTFTVRGRAC